MRSAPRRPGHEGARQGFPADGGRVHRRNRAHGRCEMAGSRGAAHRKSEHRLRRHPTRPGRAQRNEAARHRAARRSRARAPAGVLHRLPGAAGVLGDEADRARVGRVSHLADIGCHTFSTLPPFNIGNTVLGYGLDSHRIPESHRCSPGRTVTIMGDGGFWHNGLTSGIANAVFNKSDGILVIMKNGYTSATGTQNIPPPCTRPSGNRAT